jgi:hypothetical protein
MCQRQAGADLSEESVLAGAVELFAYDRDYDDPRETVRRIYGAIRDSECPGSGQTEEAEFRRPKSLGRL